MWVYILFVYHVDIKEPEHKIPEAEFISDLKTVVSNEHNEVMMNLTD